MEHSFNIDIAVKYGVNAAILLNNIAFWIRKNEANGTNYHDGHYWTYNSLKAFREMFPYMGERQIRTSIKRLVDDGIIITGNYNEKPYDRTQWYAITKKGKSICLFGTMDADKMTNPFVRNDTPIPYINTDINTNIRETTKENPECFDKFWQAYPKQKDKENARKAFAKLKVDDDLLDVMLDALEWQKQTDEWQKQGGHFIPYPSTWLNGKRWEDERSVVVKRSSGNPFLDMLMEEGEAFDGN